MCGFAGIFNNSFPIAKDQLQNIANQVSFRGPDSCGMRLFSDEFIAGETGTNAVFFNRLAILDLDSRSDQPFEDEDFSLTFNGEIYNYTQLKYDLQSHGHTFHTTSDTEVLFHALKEWGTEALHRINGMFSFCWLWFRGRQNFASVLNSG